MLEYTPIHKDADEILKYFANNSTAKLFERSSNNIFSELSHYSHAVKLLFSMNLLDYDYITDGNPIVITGKGLSFAKNGGLKTYFQSEINKIILQKEIDDLNKQQTQSVIDTNANVIKSGSVSV